MLTVKKNPSTCTFYKWLAGEVQEGRKPLLNLPSQ